VKRVYSTSKVVDTREDEATKVVEEDLLLTRVDERSEGRSDEKRGSRRGMRATVDLRVEEAEEEETTRAGEEGTRF